MNKYLGLGAAALTLWACGKTAAPPPESPEPEPAPEMSASPVKSLDDVLEALPEDAKARFPYRHPKETLAFFGVEPGMTVVDLLSGDVWYGGILLDYLGPDGRAVAADYSPTMWTKFGDYSRDPEKLATWTDEKTAAMEKVRDEGDAAVGAIQFGSVPDEMAGTVDVILAMRAMHHFMRLEKSDGYLTQALADMMKLLKPGGIVGVVQHRAPAGNSDEWADGSQGYVKEDALIAAFEAAGFELVEKSDLNANPKDQPTEQDVVWRLPPTYATSQGNDELKAQMSEIGESDRMTLKFRKPE